MLIGGEQQADKIKHGKYNDHVNQEKKSKRKYTRSIYLLKQSFEE